jgi:hypothetical protein
LRDASAYLPRDSVAAGRAASPQSFQRRLGGGVVIDTPAEHQLVLRYAGIDLRARGNDGRHVH